MTTAVAATPFVPSPLTSANDFCRMSDTNKSWDLVILERSALAAEKRSVIPEACKIISGFRNYKLSQTSILVQL